MSGFSAPGYLNVTSSIIPTNGVYLPAANAVGFSSNSTLLFEYAVAGNIGRAGAFTHLFMATGNGVAIRGNNTAGVLTAIDFSNSADTQCGAINMNQAALTANYNTSSDERGKPYRVQLDFEIARDVICGLKIYDHDDERNLIHGVGVVAQEAYAVLPRMVTPGDSDKHLDLDNPFKELWMVDYSKAVPYLIAHCQYLQQQIDELKKQQGLK
jgi:hypothetical protein